MYRTLEFSGKFKKRMMILAIITALIIAISMPLTYIKLLWGYEKIQVNQQSENLAAQLQKYIKENPELWQYNAQKFTEVFTKHASDGLVAVNVYDNDDKLIFGQEYHTDHYFSITGISPIVYNNQTFGYVNTEYRIDSIIWTTILLFIGFTLLAGVIGWSLYKFPARIVTRSEEEIINAFNKLNYLSFTDPLTTLPNRASFLENLNRIIETAKSNNQKVALMFLDLDRFKNVNDTLGHSFGDILLKQVAERLKKCVRDGDFVARLGGDEFTIILSEVKEFKEVESIAQRVISELNMPFNLQNHEIFVTPSIGISMYPADGGETEVLLRNADTAMYRSKEAGKNRYKFFIPEMNREIAKRLILENDLRKALTNNELLLYYHPILSLKTGRINGFEALLRWKHPHLGLIAPDRFIPIAEESGIINEIGEWVLQTACEFNKKLQHSGLTDLYVSVNLSGKQLQLYNLEETITSIVNGVGMDPKTLVLEITETIAMLHEEIIIDRLNRLKNRGYRIAIDDFGTGYSSLSRLKRFPVDILKIDKSFINKIPKETYDSAIAASIISMAHNLGLKVTAEGVESNDQLQFLRKHSCDSLQGFYITIPLPEEEFEAFLIENELLRII